MDKETISLIDESIALEMNVSKVYSVFHKALPDDADFWWRLAMEEKNHAALLKCGKEFFEPHNQFPTNILLQNIQILKAINQKLLAIAEKYTTTPPTREEALNTALSIEKSAGEQHFQMFMEAEANQISDNIFKKLNKADKEHIQRISSYMQQHGISEA